VCGKARQEDAFSEFLVIHGSATRVRKSSDITCHATLRMETDDSG
jgi:hypothetical protein